MPATAIITDSDSSIPAEISERLQIRQVPINIHFGEETLRTGIDINDSELFARVDRGDPYPTTSAPSPGQFVEAFQEAFEAGARDLVCYCVSAEVSATYNAARQACNELPDKDITVVDTRSLSLGQGFLAIAAAEAARQGASRDEILSLTKDMGGRCHLFAALATLKYLAKSGRVPTLQASIGNLLNVMPVLTIRDGTLDLLERVRTRKKAWPRVVELALEAAGDKPVERMGVIHVNAPDEARQFLDLLSKSLEPPQDTIFAELTPGLSVHGGTGMVGVVFIKSR